MKAIHLTRLGMETSRAIDQRGLQLQVGGTADRESRASTADRRTLGEAMEDLRQSPADSGTSTRSVQPAATLAGPGIDARRGRARARQQNGGEPGGPAAADCLVPTISTWPMMVHGTRRRGSPQVSFFRGGAHGGNFAAGCRRRSISTTTCSGIWPKSRTIRGCRRPRGPNSLPIKLSAAAAWPVARGAGTARRAFARLKERKLYPADRIELGSESDETLRALGDYEASNGNLTRAIEIDSMLLDSLMRTQTNAEQNLADAVRLSRLFVTLADFQRRAGQMESASKLDAQRLALWEHWDKMLPGNTFVMRQLIAARG